MCRGLAGSGARQAISRLGKASEEKIRQTALIASLCTSLWVQLETDDPLGMRRLTWVMLA